MRTYTAKCSHPGCDRKFTKKRRNVAEQALRMHVGRAHTGAIPTNKHRRTNAAVSLNGATVPVDRRTKAWRAANPKPGTRSVTKRQPKLADTAEVKINFCPGCGCNLHSVAVGMAMANLG